MLLLIKMVNTNQKMKDFQSKSYDERLKISMNIITNLKNRWNAQAQHIFDIVSRIDKVPESLLDSIYKDFCDSIERIQQEKLEWELHNFEKSKNYINKLRDMEQIQSLGENPDWILDWLDDLL